MDLKSFLTRYPEVFWAGAADQADLCEFFNRSPMKGKGLQLLYWRGPTFAAFLDCQSSHHFVFFVRGEDGTVEGAGTIVLRPGMVGGVRQTVGYLGDLRVDNIRRWGRYWRDFYFDLMKHAGEIDEFQGVRYFFTGILKQNAKAQRALGGSKIGYHPWHSYRMVNVLRGWWPLRRHFQVRSWADVPEAELWDFHREANRAKPLGWVFDETHHEGRWRLQHWPGFGLEDGFALSDQQGVALSGAFWSPGTVKKIIVQRIPPLEKRLFAWLSPWLRLPREGEELKCLYLTMLERRAGLDEEAWQKGVRQLVGIGLKLARARGFHCVSVAEFDAAPLKQALRPYVALKTDLELYLVDPMRNPGADFTRAVPGFEMGLV